MKFEYFIAKRFLKGEKQSFSRPIVRIATLSIALGIAVMIISISVLRGFQGEIKRKVAGFGSHIQVKHFAASNSLEQAPVNFQLPCFASLKTSIQGITSVQPYAYLGGMIKTKDQIQGIVLKGLPNNADTSFYAENLQQGRLLHWKAQSDSGASNEVIVSSILASKLGLKINEKLRVYFLVEENLRARVFTIVGIYRTGLGSFDEKFVIGDLKQIQKLNGWQPNQAEGVEITVANFADLDNIAKKTYKLIDYDLGLQTIDEMQPALFSWLGLLDMNVLVIFTIMMLVSVVCVVSTLLIMIFEKTSEIGVLKTLGATNGSVRSIFLIKASFIIVKGIVYGNLFAGLLCFVQYKFKILTLNSQSFMLDYVPIDYRLNFALLISLGVLVVCMITLILPTTIISNIRPAKIVKAE